jgi:hypothetical protein
MSTNAATRPHAMVPTFIRSPDKFQAVVQLGSTPESLVLEFKAKIDHTRGQGNQPETCRDIAQFANTWGGCLLVGVTGVPGQTRGMHIADAIQPVLNIDNLRQWIEQAITNHLVPSTFTHDLTPITLQEGEILAVNVPASRHLVSLWNKQKHTVEYLRRTSHGKEWMNPDEAERHLMDGSRAAKLAILAAKAAAKTDEVELAGGISRRTQDSNRPDHLWKPPNVKFGKIEEYWFEICVPTEQETLTIQLPYGVVEEAWATGVGQTAVLLSVRLIFHQLSNGSVLHTIMEPLR